MFERGAIVRVDKWTPAEDRRLIELRSKQKTYRFIAVELGRSLRACHARYEKLTQPALCRRERLPVKRVKAQTETSVKIIPLSAWQDREQRLNAERDLTQTFFGDPPFSQSALGKKLAGAES